MLRKLEVDLSNDLKRRETVSHNFTEYLDKGEPLPI